MYCLLNRLFKPLDRIIFVPMQCSTLLIPFQLIHNHWCPPQWLAVWNSFWYSSNIAWYVCSISIPYHYLFDTVDNCLATVFHSAWRHIDGLVQERHNSIANALELRLSCTNPSISLGCSVPLNEAGRYSKGAASCAWKYNPKRDRCNNSL